MRQPHVPLSPRGEARILYVSDPSSIAGGMAVALITTLYGAVLSTASLLPMAEKLAYYSRQEMLAREIIIRGILAIQAGEHPRLIAQRLDVKESEVIEMEQRLASRDLSIDQPSDDETGGTLLDVLPGQGLTAEQEVADAEFRKEVGDRIHAFGKTLKDKEAMIFTERLLAEQPLTLQEIGDKYGISRERVRQIEERLKKRLRAYLQDEMKDLRDGVLDLD